MKTSLPSAATVGEIARRNNAPVHRVEYLIRSRDIWPIGRAGNARLFAESDADRIGADLRRIDEDARQKHAKKEGDTEETADV